MLSAGSWVLCVGHRAGALEALRRTGTRARALVARAPGRRARAGYVDVVERDLSDADAVEVAARWAAEDGPPAAVVALIEGAVVLAAQIRARLGLSGVDPAAAERAHDKVAMKRAFEAGGVACARHVPVEADTRPEALVERLGLPLVLKPRRSSGSRGVIICRGLDDVAQAWPGAVAEAFVRGVEMSVESFVHRGEIVFASPTRYLWPGWANVVPAGLDDATRRRVLDLNRRVIAALGVDRGVTHLELFLTDEGPVAGEIALRPPGGWLMDLISDVYATDAWAALMAVEAGTAPPAIGPARKAAGVWVLHPGAGVCVAVHGVDAARAIPGVDDVVCALAPGDVVGDRVGVGQSVGRVLASGPDPASVATTLTAARAAIAFDMRSDR